MKYLIAKKGKILAEFNDNLSEKEEATLELYNDEKILSIEMIFKEGVTVKESHESDDEKVLSSITLNLV